MNRRVLQLGLGGLWLLDGALQLQPFMFGQGFADDVIARAADGQPHVLAVAVNFASTVIGAHPVVWNAIFATTQIALGVALLVPATVRVGLLGTIGWSMGVWCFGEGLGGLASGHALMLTGAPGAAILYAGVAVAAWPSVRPAETDADRFPKVLAAVWAGVWVGTAVMNALPGQNSAADIATLVAQNAGGAPRWLSSLDLFTARAMPALGTTLVPLMVAVQVAVGIAAFDRRTRYVAVVGGLVISAFYWAVGQSFGELYSGQATDPGTAVVVAVLALGLLPSKRLAPISQAEPGRRALPVPSPAR